MHCQSFFSLPLFVKCDKPDEAEGMFHKFIWFLAHIYLRKRQLKMFLKGEAFPQKNRYLDELS